MGEGREMEMARCRGCWVVMFTSQHRSSVYLSSVSGPCASSALGIRSSPTPRAGACHALARGADGAAWLIVCP